jgi:hypothetical protein
MKQNFELRKLRDFGQVFNDTFVFFKDNLKPLMRSLFVICGILMLISAVSSASTFLNMSSVFNFTPGADTYDMERHTMSYMLGAFISASVVLITISCINLVTMCYMSVYLQNKSERPTTVQVWGYFKYYFWRVLGANILLGILTGIGAVFCFLPGIYLGVVFSLVTPIIVIENASFGYAFNKSFSLIRDNWWFVFGVFIVMYLIVSIANGIAGAPLSMAPLLGKMVSNSTVTTPVIIFFSVLRSLLLVTYSLLTISVTLCYFDLSEKKEGTGLLGRIEDFGKAEPQQEMPGEPEPQAEEY